MGVHYIQCVLYFCDVHWYLEESRNLSIHSIVSNVFIYLFLFSQPLALCQTFDASPPTVVGRIRKRDPHGWISESGYQIYPDSLDIWVWFKPHSTHKLFGWSLENHYPLLQRAVIKIIGHKSIFYCNLLSLRLQIKQAKNEWYISKENKRNLLKMWRHWQNKRHCLSTGASSSLTNEDKLSWFSTITSLHKALWSGSRRAAWPSEKYTFKAHQHLQKQTALAQSSFLQKHLPDSQFIFALGRMRW